MCSAAILENENSPSLLLFHWFLKDTKINCETKISNYNRKFMQYVYVGMEYDPTLKSFLQSLLQTSGRTNCRAIFDTAGSEIFSIHECCLDNEAKRSTGKGKKSKKRSTLQTELKRSIYLDHHHLVLNGYKETVVHCARSYHRGAIKKGFREPLTKRSFGRPSEIRRSHDRTIPRYAGTEPSAPSIPLSPHLRD